MKRIPFNCAYCGVPIISYTKMPTGEWVYYHPECVKEMSQ